MTLLEHIHGGFVYGRRSEVLSTAVARLIPDGSRVLDVGAGDGLIASLVQRKSNDVTIEGIDTLVRPATLIPVRQFDGGHLPYDDDSFDVVTFVDVLHHTEDPMVLLREAARVTRRWVVIKDHRRNGLFAQRTLHFMDRVGNSRHGVVIPANFWAQRQWMAGFDSAGLELRSWTTKVPLYPAWAAWVFGRGLHFMARLEKR